MFSFVREQDAQYMVEFSLSFVIFVIFVFFVIDIGLLIYNHNLFYRGVSEGARTAALGRSNDEIQNTVHDQIVPKVFPTMLLAADPGNLQITPSNEMRRVEGQEVTLNMDTTFGMSLLNYGVIRLDLPIESRAVIHRKNDQDRDGCKDSLEASSKSCDSYQNFSSTFSQDHDNDGVVDQYIFDGPDTDADNDGIPWDEDYVVIAYRDMGDTFGIRRPNNDDPGLPFPNSLLAGCPTMTIDGQQYYQCHNGRYQAPELWGDADTDVAGSIEGSASIFPKQLPSWHVENSGEIGFTTRNLWTEHDRDNDGWEDKYDEFPEDPTRH